VITEAEETVFRTFVWQWCKVRRRIALQQFRLLRGTVKKESKNDV
jgi:hypothetical protein